MKISLKTKLLFCFVIGIIQISCSQKPDIVIANFEDDTCDGWTIEGDAFGPEPSKGAGPGQQEVTGFKGKGFANSFAQGGDDAKGTLSSPEFTIERNYINFLIGGGKNTDTYIELIIDGKSILRNSSLINSENLHPLTWSVKEYIGEKAQIKIVDNQQGSWGHILIDQIEQSDNIIKSDILLNYQLTFEATKKYILIPIEEKAPETRITLLIDGVANTTHSNIRIAHTTIDYWVPVEIEAYKGKKVALLFDQFKESYIGLNQIKLSDVFEFDYNETYRPVFHFSPEYGWTNDPNGMVYSNGVYHLFYQHNPYGSMWGNMSWGHATTTDLKIWKHHPVAIIPDSIGTIFSGSAVIDKDNTAGFGRNAMVAIYTAHGQSETQCLAYSTDNGVTFNKYDHNPVLCDSTYVDYRDPKVFWHDATKQWIMSLATTQVITFYGSKNLKDWTMLSNFGDGIGDHGGVWECPDLFPISYNGQNKWVLFVSINPGGPNGGSATQYFIGNFDGKTFKADKLPYPLWIDYGRDNYAGVTWNNAPNGQRIFIGWMSNWDYTNQVPTLNFRNAMTVPRELSLVNNGEHLVIASIPVKEIAELRGEEKMLGTIKVNKSYTVNQLLPENRGACEIEMTIKPQASNNFTFELRNKKDEKIQFVFDLGNKVLSVDRTKSGIVDFNNNFAGSPIKAPIVKKDTYKIRLLVDKSSTELFINDGEVVQTNCVFPTEPYNILTFSSDAELIAESVAIYPIN